MSLSLQQCAELGIYTQQQALHLIGGLVKASGFTSRRRRSRVDEARNVLSNVVLVHVPVRDHCFQEKSMFLARQMRAYVPLFDREMISVKFVRQMAGVSPVKLVPQF